jgi:hypothetical protein
VISDGMKEHETNYQTYSKGENMKQTTKLALTSSAFACALAASTALAQFDSGPDRPLALAPAAATSSGGGGAGEEPKDQAAELAKQLQNPIASLTLVPFQNNFDWGAGRTGEGFQYKLNFQPVSPTALNEDWNMISRTILPFVYQEDVVGTSSQSGLADTLESLFFSPSKPTKRGWIWGAGPVLLIPTATDSLLGADKWGAGPTAVLLKQNNAWTYGALMNHLWSFAGDNDREDVNTTFLQPFLAYTTKKHTTFSLNTESTFDWIEDQWVVPINVSVQQLLKVGNQPIALQLGYRYYAEKPETGPDWGLRFTITLLYPKK